MIFITANLNSGFRYFQKRTLSRVLKTHLFLQPTILILFDKTAAVLNIMGMVVMYSSVWVSAGRALEMCRCLLKVCYWGGGGIGVMLRICIKNKKLMDVWGELTTSYELLVFLKVVHFLGICSIVKSVVWCLRIDILRSLWNFKK